MGLYQRASRPFQLPLCFPFRDRPIVSTADQIEIEVRVVRRFAGPKKYAAFPELFAQQVNCEVRA
jgi:hypothetical protein